jgi:hypothetical protein
MSLINLSMQHGNSFEEARSQLARSVAEMQRRFGPFLSRTAWSDNDSRVLMVGTGCEVEVWVDATQIHLRGDIPLLAKLFGDKLIAGIKGLLEHDFQKRLT